MLDCFFYHQETASAKEITPNLENTTLLTCVEEYTIIENEPQTITFKCTAYCPCHQCCGKTDRITSTGAVATAGRTIAVDPTVIPYGSVVQIGGNTFIAEDCGGAIDDYDIDIFFDTHEEALAFGVQHLKGVIIK